MRSVCLYLAVFCSSSIQAQEPDLGPRELQIYDVRNLVADIPESAIPARPQGNLVYWNDGESRDPDMPLFGYKPEPPGPSADIQIGGGGEEEGSPSIQLFREEWLRELISRVAYRMVEGSVEDEEGLESLVIRRGYLFLDAPKPVHVVIGELLRKLEALASERYSVECVVGPTAVLDQVRPGWDQPDANISAEAFEVALARSGTRLLSAIVPANRWVTSGKHRSKAMVTDHRVVQTGVIPVSNPEVSSPKAGEWLNIRVSPLRSTGAMVIDLSIGNYEVSSEEFSPGSDWSQLELPRIREILHSSTCLAEDGKVLLSTMAGSEGEACWMRVKRLGATPPGLKKSESKDYRYEAYDVGALLRSSSRRMWWPNDLWKDQPVSEGKNRIDSEYVIELIFELTGGEEVWDEDNTIDFAFDHLHVFATKNLQARVRNILEMLEKQRLRQARVNLSVLEMPRAAIAALRALRDADGYLPENWRNKLAKEAIQSSSKYQILALGGESHALRVATISSLVTGVELISGGTGFAILDTADPSISTCGDGREFRVRVDWSSDGGLARLRVQGAEARMVSKRDVPIVFPMIAVAKQTHQTPAPMMYLQKMLLQLPEQEVIFWSLDRSLAKGKPAILDITTAGDRATVLIGRVD